MSSLWQKGDVGGSSPADICQKLSQVLNAPRHNKLTCGSGVVSSFFSRDGTREQKQKTVTVKCDYTGKSEASGGGIRSCSVKVTHTFPFMNDVIACPRLRGGDGGFTKTEQRRESEEREGEAESESGQSVCIKVTAGLMRTEWTVSSRFRWK